MFNAQRRLVIPAVMACAIGVGAASVRAEDAPTTAPSVSNADLQQKVEQLEAKVQALETQKTTTASATSAKNNAAAVSPEQSVVNDADSQGKLMDATNVTTGWDPANGFHIASDDGNFYLHPYGLFQFDGVLNWRASVQPATEGEVGEKGTLWQTGFEVRRLELGMDGHLWNPDFKYFVQFNTVDSTGGPYLQDAYITDRLGDSPWFFKAGQFIDPVWHEDSVGDGNQLAVDRSLVSGFLGGGLTSPAGGGGLGVGYDVERVQGVGIQFQQGKIHGEADIHDGYNSGDTKFIDTASMALAPKPENFGMSGRFEYELFGDDAGWAEYNQFSSQGDKEDILVLGAGTEWTENGDENNWWYTFDAQWDTASGIDVYAAIYGYNDNIPKAVTILGNAGIAGHFDSSGFVLQGGYMLSKQWEPFARWDLTHIDGKLAPHQHTTNEFTVGVNYYLAGQRAKFSLDGSFFPSGPETDADGLGVLENPREHELDVRAQFQLEI